MKGDRTTSLGSSRESDGLIVPEKHSNKGEVTTPAESVEGRGPTEGNTFQSTAICAQSQGFCDSGLGRVRARARRDKKTRFTTLLPHITVELLKGSFHHLKKRAAPGVDRVTWQAYSEGLDERLQDLNGRLHRGAFRVQPSRRVYIPKEEGERRPLGIASLEDKIVQQAFVTVLNCIYEEEFKGFSYGFRPGRGPHDALDALAVGIEKKPVRWVLDADIRRFFDTIDHDWMMKFLKHKIADRRVLRYISLWLKAGVLEEGEWSETLEGTPQGGVISPLLANVYLHYAFDLWVERWRQTNARGAVTITRYADDWVAGFQLRADAKLFRAELEVRLKNFNLELHEEKTRLIEFGKYAIDNRRDQGDGCPETFNFLGFTHVCSTGPKGWFKLERKTIGKRLRDKLKQVKQELKRRTCMGIEPMGRWLRSVVQGFYNYYGVPGNVYALGKFRTEIRRIWLKVLRRRSHKSRMSWTRFELIAKRWIPKARTCHAHPWQRCCAIT